MTTCFKQAAGSRQRAVKTLLLRCLLPAACCLLSAAPAHADDALRTELATVAKGIAEAVKGLGHEAIAVGEFTGPGSLAASGGPAITKTLAEELPKQGVAVRSAAPVGVRGEFEDVKDQQSGLLAARIKGAVTDRSGRHAQAHCAVGCWLRNRRCARSDR